MNLRGLILAAGAGRRLLPLTADRPKALVEVGRTTLLERLIRQCELVGMEEVIVVTGYQADRIQEWVNGRSWNAEIRLVFNPDFDTMNNIKSLFVAKDAVAGSGFVKLDSDLMAHSKILRRLVGTTDPSTVVVDREVSLQKEEMKVQLNDERQVTSMGKWLDPALCHGEFIGLAMIGARDTDRLFGAVEQMLGQGRVDAYYEDVYHQMVSEGWQLATVETKGLPWAEIDRPEDLAHARRLLPQIDTIASC